MAHYIVIVDTRPLLGVEGEDVEEHVLLGYLQCLQDLGYIRDIIFPFFPIPTKEYVEMFSKELIGKGLPELSSKAKKLIEAIVGEPDIALELQFLKESGISGAKLEEELEALKIESSNWSSGKEGTVIDIVSQPYEIEKLLSKRYGCRVRLVPYIER